MKDRFFFIEDVLPASSVAFSMRHVWELVQVGQVAQVFEFRLLVAEGRKFVTVDAEGVDSQVERDLAACGTVVDKAAEHHLSCVFTLLFPVGLRAWSALLAVSYHLSECQRRGIADAVTQSVTITGKIKVEVRF